MTPRMVYWLLSALAVASCVPAAILCWEARGLDRATSEMAAEHAAAFAAANEKLDRAAGLFMERSYLEMGDAGHARVPGCRTVETDWGTCIEAGVYTGDPILLMGHAPYFHANVEIDYRGAEAPRIPCPDGSAADVCLERLPFGSATITVHEASQ